MGDSFDVIDGAGSNTVAVTDSGDYQSTVGSTTGAAGSGVGADFTSFLHSIFSTAAQYADRLSHSGAAYPGGVTPPNTYVSGVHSGSAFSSGTILLVVVLAVVLWAVLDHRKG